jgi:uncharacterized protein (DUF1015 family)
MALLSPYRAALPLLSKIKSPNSFFRDVKVDFRSFLQKGFYEQDEQPAFYIHRVQTKYRSYTGFNAYIHLDDYREGRIRKHEHTIRAKEDQVMELYEERKALIKPVMLTYPNVLEIDALTNRITFSLKPALEFDFDDERHTIWRIDQPEYLETYARLFAEKVPLTYIADGHHRSETSLQYCAFKQQHNPGHTGQEAYNFLLAELYPASEIEIHNYNRLLETLNGLSGQQFLERLSEVYDIEATSKSYKPATPHNMGMYLFGQWYRLTVKPAYLQERPAVRDRLDVAIFNQVVLRGILGVEDVRTYPKIKYQEGPKGTVALIEMVDEGDATVAFNLYPVALEDMIAIAREDGVLPPKSTWFFPRLRSGFTVQLFE